MRGVREGWRTRVGRSGALAAVVLGLVVAFAPSAASEPAGADEPVVESVVGDGEQLQRSTASVEQPASLAGRPVVAVLLLSIGIWALIFAFKVPGTGVPEVVAVLAFGAFLFGKYAAGLAGWEDVALVAVGALLLALEIFVVPGVGIAGILGVLAMGAGLVLAAVGHGPSSELFWPEVARAAVVLGVSVGLGVTWSVLAFLALRKTEMWKRFTLRGELAPADDDPGEAHRALAALAGSEGVAVTALSPEGEVEVGGTTYPARAETGYLDPKSRIAVASHDGRRLVVRAADSENERFESNEGDAT